MSAPEGSHPDARAADPAEMPLTLLGGDAWTGACFPRPVRGSRPREKCAKTRPESGLGGRSAVVPGGPPVLRHPIERVGRG
jgi:hypothetical protein